MQIDKHLVVDELRKVGKNEHVEQAIKELPATVTLGRPADTIRHLTQAAIEAAKRLDKVVFDAVAVRRKRGLSLFLVPAAYSGAAGLPWVGLVMLIRVVSPRSERLSPARAAVGVLGGWGAAQILKRRTERSRPCHGGGVSPLVKCPNGSSMPSDQAASAFAGAAAISQAIPALRLPVYTAAALTAFSRVYVGVHFPSDVVTGAALGALVGRGVARR
jgi:PAP2 superfamily